MANIKKTATLSLALVMIFSITISACALEISPCAVELDTNITDSSGVYTSAKFTCVKGNGNSLRYWFQNTSSDSCTVQLYKVGFFGDSVVSKIEKIDAGSAKYTVYSNPGNGTFYLRVTNTSGGPVSGHLRANQLDLSAS